METMINTYNYSCTFILIIINILYLQIHVPTCIMITTTNIPITSIIYLCPQSSSSIIVILNCHHHYHQCHCYRHQSIITPPKNNTMDMKLHIPITNIIYLCPQSSSSMIVIIINDHCQHHHQSLSSSLPSVSLLPSSINHHSTKNNRTDMKLQTSFCTCHSQWMTFSNLLLLFV